jgi:hypothetical protein
MKNPEEWLPAWARGKNLPIKAVRIGGARYEVSAANAHGGHVVEIDDTGKVGARMLRHMVADPRFERVG